MGYDKLECINDSEDRSIGELTEDLMKRYKISDIDNKNGDNGKEDVVKRYSTEIRRIMQDVKVEDEAGKKLTLYELLGKGNRRPMKISTLDFLGYAYPKWRAYVEKKIEDYDRSKLIKDEDIYIKYRDKKFLCLDYEPYLVRPSNKTNITEYGIQLMIEGIFEALYGEFDWEQLISDSKCEEYYMDPGNYDIIHHLENLCQDENGKKVLVTVDEDGSFIRTSYEEAKKEGEEHRIKLEKAIERLGSFKNYIKKKSNNSVLNDVIEKENNNAEQLKKIVRKIKDIN